MLSEIAALPNPVLTTIALILGLLVGSFLNVVIFRYPRLLKHQWTLQSQDWLQQNSQEGAEEAPPGIAKPASHCRKCKAPIKAWHNIPLVSYLLLGGKCANCRAPIGIRYPMVELLTGLLTAYVIYHFGWSIQAAYGVLLTWVLIALSFIDFDHQLLPDDIVLPTLWVGLGAALLPVFANPTDVIIGAIVGYGSLWLVFQLFKLLTGKEGMGYGDFKLLALLGAWFGWQMLPQIILISSILGCIVGLTLMATKKASRDNAIPFGPYLAIGGWIAMLWGDKINQLYLNSAGF